MMVSWLISGLTFIVTVVIVIIMVKVLRNKEKQPSELERETRTCKSPLSFPAARASKGKTFAEESLSAGVDNTYVALSINK